MHSAHYRDLRGVDEGYRNACEHVQVSSSTCQSFLHVHAVQPFLYIYLNINMQTAPTLQRSPKLHSSSSLLGHQHASSEQNARKSLTLT
jgi:hypothetical protein